MPHGLTLTESTSGARTVKLPSLAVIGLVATAGAAAGAATTALNAAFPLNTPVLVTSVANAIAKAGTTGTLKPALEAIDDITSPLVVVIRVAQGADAGATEDNVIAGIQALRTAESVVGKRPRILGAPGLETADVTAELVIAAKKLRAFPYARAIGDTIVAATTYRATYSARELMLIWPNTSSDFAGDAVARALALRALIDETIGWHKTISNVPIDGVTGVSIPVHFDLLDPSTDAGVLNDAGVTTIVHAGAGFRFWGNRTCAGEDQPMYVFESAVRTLHALQDIIVSVFLPFFDQPMTVALIRDNLETVNAAFRDLVRRGWLIGAKAYFDKDANSADQLMAGRPTFRIAFTPVAPMENPTVDLSITDEFYTGFADQIT
ncbi:phage tail sheath subtilisin-like domain-containing protein [Novosphingobium sp. EMRT-2]|uniref:phage tail sheath subtilisin-like domain-containing protein n=1 Tax=Novosphingobium sp. EMRT-2 TaxID=2571749 RepID=UPI0010BD2C18|nr:phage tail sheath subtilisin-like domain-containing protein [Novosphingobium sp. EMRT-2]QCI92902.1 phage tail protein [Novosphingobium sp. EMRT-2]